ncbi:MAG: hypothetical protein HQM14_03335 [SAR324 cluster bacterium]|nr:hypothetical protein [SAR324 cluster bacterium]
MKKRSLAILWISSLSILFLESCLQSAFVLTAEGKQVQLFHHPEEYPQCIFIDSFRAMTLTGRDNSYQQALIKIKNRVAVYEGNRLKISTSDTDDLVTTITGEGYRCPVTPEGSIQDVSVDSKYQITQ